MHYRIKTKKKQKKNTSKHTCLPECEICVTTQAVHQCTSIHFPFILLLIFNKLEGMLATYVGHKKMIHRLFYKNKSYKHIQAEIL